MSPRPVRSLALLAMAAAFAAALLACGGQSDNKPLSAGDDGGPFATEDGGTCAVLPCPSNSAWNDTICGCEALDNMGFPVVVDAMAQCPPMLCPYGTMFEQVGSFCACVGGALPDAGPDDSPYYPPVYDAPYYPPPSMDAPYYPYPPYPYDSGPYCPYYNNGYNPCGTGYTMGPNCQCELCPDTCPIGEMPGLGCNGCTACTTRCPAGFDYGPSCTCVPHGVDAGPPVPPDASDGGGGCLLEGYNNCAAGSWCQLGTCPDGRTEYGCYCDQKGNATCSLTCPVPPPCTIPGQAACPYGQQCVYGSCSADPASDLLVCSCNSGSLYFPGGPGFPPGYPPGYSTDGGSPASSASCYTASCADGGPQYLPDAGPPSGGVTCLLEGYYSCSAGSYCSLGTCPDGTPYGCTCNQDGTATCDLTCPPPPPCQIPGEGSCPYGTSCVFGCGSGSNGTGLSCYCGWGGSANCNTVQCSQVTDGG